MDSSTSGPLVDLGLDKVPDVVAVEDVLWLLLPEPPETVVNSTAVRGLANAKVGRLDLVLTLLRLVIVVLILVVVDEVVVVVVIGDATKRMVKLKAELKESDGSGVYVNHHVRYL